MKKYGNVYINRGGVKVKREDWYRKIQVISLILLVFLSPVTVSAHSGRTDSKGGNYVKATGEYHYHHGKTAHQ